MKTPLFSKRVSYIFYTRNHAPLLDEALKRMRELKKSEDEVIVVDGGSTDNTAAVVAKYQDLVEVFISEPDFSLGHALNRGILVSNGKYLHPMADDDTTYPEPMEQAVKIMDEHPEIDLLVCGGEKFKNNRLRMFYVPPGVNYGSDLKDSFNYGACGAGFLIRRDALARIGRLYAVGLLGDLEFVTQLISSGKATVKFCRLKLFYHPILEHSHIKKFAKESAADSDRVMRKYCSKTFYWKVKLKALYNRIHWRLYVRIFGQRPPDKKMEYTWDGGFS